MHKPIHTKADMYRRLMMGEFGNHSQAWGSVDEVLDSGFRDLISIRSISVSFPVKLYHVPVAELRETVDGVCQSRGCLASSLMFQECPPDQRPFQGEIQQSIHGAYDLFCTTEDGPMRTALEKGGVQKYGLEAVILLRHYLIPSDYDELVQLIGDYPGCVVEFSCHYTPVGVYRKRMLIWEVRHY